MEKKSSIKKHSYKNQIRDIKRFLKKCQGDDEKVKQLQDKLYELEITSYVTTHKEDIKKLRKVNKKLRFNERMKILRIMDNKKDADKKSEKTNQLEFGKEAMLKYTEYYPDCEKYIPLFPHKPLSEDQKQLQKIIMEYTDSAKEELERIQQEELQNDQKYRRSILPKMLKILKEMREKSELANIHSEEETNKEDDGNELKSQQLSEDELDDDFFMNE